MLTKQQAMSLTHGDILHHVKLRGSDNLPVRVRVSGRCVTWKTRPAEWRLPVKWGLYRSLDINQTNACLWCVPGEENNHV